jgi:hypothetical protein
MSHGTLYGASEAVRRLYAAVVAAAPADLRGQLQALARLGFGLDSASVEAVRGALFRAYGWR